MEEIASGGELSRVMLALKASVEAGSARKKISGAQRTMVFDEIDTGVFLDLPVFVTDISSDL